MTLSADYDLICRIPDCFRNEIKSQGLVIHDLLARVGEVNRPPGGKQTVRHIARRLGIGPSTRVLEIGCNTGFTSIELVKITGCSSIGVDVTNRSLKRHGVAVAATTWAGKPVRFEVGDACALPFRMTV